MTDATAGPRALDSIDVQRLLEYLPHRYPFLLVDRIVEIDGDRSCVGVKNVTANEPQFMGHFPGRPIFPGVLQIEAMAQTAGALCMHAMERTDKPRLVYFMTIEGAKFRKPVTPGDQLRLHMTKLAQKRNVWRYRGEAMVDGALVSEAEISAMIVS